MAVFEFEPSPGRLIVEPQAQADKSEGGIYLPEKSKDRPQLGTVVAYRPSQSSIDDAAKNGQVGGSIGVCGVGDTIFHSKYGGTEVKISNKDYLILREDDVLAVQRKAGG